MLIHPVRALYVIGAEGVLYCDCDDASMLVAALCAAIGISFRFRAICPDVYGNFTHVYPELCISGDVWLSADPTIPGGVPAWTGDSLLVNQDQEVL